MPVAGLDTQRLRRALELAENAIGVSDPNPRVGCVIGRDDGTLLGEGSTQRAGGAHAEIMALRAAQAAGHDVRGATAWVTLEPCAHHGRTPPCCDALIGAGIARVVVAIVDPSPQVAGAGMARMRAAGVEVTLVDAATDIAADARDINVGFFSRIERGRPWVRLKAAISLDGRTALHNGISQWITGATARADGHAWRKRSGAVLTGIGTVLSDDPRLDVRLVPTQVQPLRVVLDSHLALPVNARLLDAPGNVLVVTVDGDPARFADLGKDNVQVLRLPAIGGKVDLNVLMAELAGRGVNELHVEAGAMLNGALLQSGMVDELLVYMAPLLIGQGRDLATFGPLVELGSAPAFRIQNVMQLDEDLRIIARQRGSDPTKPRS